MDFISQYSVYKKVVEEAIVALQFKAHSPSNLYEPLDYILQLGGKRLRPVMVLAACEAFGGDPKSVVDPALAIEVFHNFSLIHDDIMDEAPVRRGQPTVHTRWGTNVGILSGDLMLTKSYELMMNVPAPILRDALRIFNDTATKVCEGQQMDMEFERLPQVTIPEYLLMIRYKTAVLLGGALEIGALAGGASAQDAHHLYEFGCSIGTAFQIKDDWLDAFGDPEKVGKQPGGDIIQGKKTFLVLRALELAQNGQSEKMTRALDAQTQPSDRLHMVMEVFQQLGIKEVSYEAIAQHYTEALQHLERVNLEPRQKQFFKEFAEFLIHRDF